MPESGDGNYNNRFARLSSVLSYCFCSKYPARWTKFEICRHFQEDLKLVCLRQMMNGRRVITLKIMFI